MFAPRIRGAVARGRPYVFVRVSRWARHAAVASMGCSVVPGRCRSEPVFRCIGLNRAVPHGAARHLCRSAFVRPVLGRHVRVGVSVVRVLFLLHGFRKLARAVRKRRARRYAHGLTGFAFGAAIRFARPCHRRRARQHERRGAPYGERCRAGTHAHRRRPHGVGHGRRPGAKSCAMRARGYDCGARRTTSARFRLGASDAAVLAAVVALALASAVCAWLAFSGFAFYPVVAGVAPFWLDLPYALLMLVPPALWLRDWLQWRSCE